MPYDNEQSYSWLDVGADITGVLSKFPHRIKEAAELDRRIQQNEIKNEDVHDAFYQWSSKIAQDTTSGGMAETIASNLNMDQGWTPQQLQSRIMQSFVEADEGEQSGVYTNRMVQSFSEFVNTAGRGMNKDLFTSIMINPVSGTATGSSLQHLSNLENSENINQFNSMTTNLEGTPEEQMQEYEKAGGLTGVNYQDNDGYKDLHTQSIHNKAAALLRDKETIEDINDGKLQKTAADLAASGVPDEVINEMYRQLNVAADYNNKIAEAVNARGRIAISNANAELARDKYNDQKASDEAQALRDIANGIEVSVNLTENSIAKMLEEAGTKVTNYSDAESEEEVAQLEAAKTEYNKLEKLLAKAMGNQGIYQTPAEAIYATTTPEFVLADLKDASRSEGYSNDEIKEKIEEEYQVMGMTDTSNGAAIILFIDDNNKYYYYNTATSYVGDANNELKNSILNPNSGVNTVAPEADKSYLETPVMYSGQQQQQQQQGQQQSLVNSLLNSPKQ